MLQQTPIIIIIIKCTPIFAPIFNAPLKTMVVLTFSMQSLFNFLILLTIIYDLVNLILEHLLGLVWPKLVTEFLGGPVPPLYTSFPGVRACVRACVRASVLENLWRLNQPSQ